MSSDTWNEMQADAAPYPVKCARCGAPGNSDEFIIEEGDEWECPPCWRRCELFERAMEEPSDQVTVSENHK